MLGQRRRRWANIKTSLFQRVVFAGLSGKYDHLIPADEKCHALAFKRLNT